MKKAATSEAGQNRQLLTISAGSCLFDAPGTPERYHCGKWTFYIGHYGVQGIYIYIHICIHIHIHVHVHLLLMRPAHN